MYTNNYIRKRLYICVTIPVYFFDDELGVGNRQRRSEPGEENAVEKDKCEGYM